MAINTAAKSNIPAITPRKKCLEESILLTGKPPKPIDHVDDSDLLAVFFEGSVESFGQILDCFVAALVFLNEVPDLRNHALGGHIDQKATDPLGGGWIILASLNEACQVNDLDPFASFDCLCRLDGIVEFFWS